MPQARKSQSQSGTASPEHRRDIAVASAAQAFALLCEAATETLELITEQFREDLEKVK